MCNQPYSWRYRPFDSHGGNAHLIHWQVTKNEPAVPKKGGEGDKFNRSIYLIDPADYPKYTRIYDHRGSAGYVVRLCIDRVRGWPMWVHTVALVAAGAAGRELLRRKW